MTATDPKRIGLWQWLFGDINRCEANVYADAGVLRKAVTAQPTELTDVDWANGTLEVVETKGQALINKTARLGEEISLRKKGDDHVETIHEKLRRQQRKTDPSRVMSPPGPAGA